MAAIIIIATQLRLQKYIFFQLERLDKNTYYLVSINKNPPHKPNSPWGGRRQWLAAGRDASKMPCAEDTLHALRLKVTVSHLQPHAMG